MLNARNDERPIEAGTHVMFDCHGTLDLYCWDGGKTWVIDSEPEGFGKALDKTTQEVAAALKERGVEMLDAPVSGGDVGAINGTLSSMIGGAQAVFDECLPVFEAMGQNINLIGGNGAGQTTKLCNQIAVAVNNMAMAEALMLAAASDLDVQKVIDAISGGAAGSWQLSNLGPRIAAGDFDPGFMVYLQQKDLRLVLGAANDIKLALPAVSMAHQFFNIVERAGCGEEGTQALIKAYEAQAGKEARA